MKKIIEGRVFKYGDNVNTDVIFPGKYTYTISDPAEMAQHALEDLDPGFADKVRTGDIIVGGSNWGCGSSREQAVTCLKVAGVGAIIARSFARIFYRNAINNGLPVIVCPQAVEAVNTEESLRINLDSGTISTGAGKYAFPEFPESVLAIMEAGGLLSYVKQKLV